MATDPRASSLATSPASVTWSNGVTFDGYVLFTLVLPFGYTQPSLKNASIFLPIPQYTRVPVVDGVIDTGTKVYYTADINPPGTLYIAEFYDSVGNLVAPYNGGASFSVTAATTTLTVPSLSTPP